MKLAPSLLVLALTACVDEPVADLTSRSQGELDVASLAGTWVESAAPGCDDCELVHELALADTQLEDTISARSPAGDELCTMSRRYAFTGPVVDYIFLAGSCAWEPRGIVFEGFARWTLDGDQLVVREQDVSRDPAPSTWTRRK